MAPKKAIGSKRHRSQSASCSTDPPDPTIDSVEGRDALQDIQARALVSERVIARDPPFDEYFFHHGWGQFIDLRPPLVEANCTLVQEFYALLKAAPVQRSYVFIRGVKVNLSTHAINELFALHTYPQDGYSFLKRDSLDVPDFTRTLLGKDVSLPVNWKSLERKDLTQAAKFLNLLVSSRFMPCVVNNRVTKKRALLIYAILKNRTVDVGRLIFSEIHSAASAKRKDQSLGFPYLITTLCFTAQVTIPPIPREAIRMRKKLEMKDIPKGPHDEDDDQSGDEDEERTHISPPPPSPPQSDSTLLSLSQQLTDLREDFTAFQQECRDHMRFHTAYIQYMLGGQQGPPPVFPPPRD